MKFDLRLILQAWKSRFSWLSGVVFGFLGGLLVILQAYLLSDLLDQVFLQGQTRDGVIPLFAGLAGVVLGRGIVAFGREYFANRVAVQVKQRLREELFRQITALGPAFINDQKSGELVNKATQGIEALDAYFSQYLPQLALAALIPISILVVVFPSDWLSGLILLLTAPLIPIFMILIGRVSESTTRKQWTALNRLSNYFLDTLQGLRELKQLGQSEARAHNVAKASDDYRLATMQVLRVTFLSAFALEFIATISTAIIAVQIGLRLLAGGMLFREAFFILVLAPEFYQPLRMLGQRFHAGMNGVTAAGDIFGLLEMPVPGTAGQAKISLRPQREPVEISFEQVSFTYPGREDAAVQDITFTLRPGEQVALVGESGAGKSTLAGLLMGFIRADAGQILAGGRPIETLDGSDWRKRVTWIPQSPYLFNTSLGANIALGNPEASKDEILGAAEQAHLQDLIEALPAGLDTPVGEQGVRLSGGQAQRIALARAFLRDTPVLVMDEPTAHLDAELEAWLEESVQRLCRGRTTLVIAHRLPTVIHSDRILVMDNGRIIESGDHSGLLLRSGAYATLIRAYGGLA